LFRLPWTWICGDLNYPNGPITEAIWRYGDRRDKGLKLGGLGECGFGERNYLVMGSQIDARTTFWMEIWRCPAHSGCDWYSISGEIGYEVNLTKMSYKFQLVTLSDENECVSYRLGTVR
jgi:hypothetical protein